MLRRRDEPVTFSIVRIFRYTVVLAVSDLGVHIVGGRFAAIALLAAWACPGGHVWQLLFWYEAVKELWWVWVEGGLCGDYGSWGAEWLEMELMGWRGWRG